MQKLGFGWALNLEEEISPVFLSDITPVPLVGNFDSGFALADYSVGQGANRRRTNVGELVHRFKYQGNRRAGMILADLASDFINGRSCLRSCDVMLTVPPSFKSRALDPVSLVAERIEERTQIRWERAALKRTRLAKPQKDLRLREMKRLNVFDAFRLTKPLNWGGEKILLIDDLFDSGATLNNISDTLKEGRPKEINVLVLARSRFSVGIESSR